MSTLFYLEYRDIDHREQRHDVHKCEPWFLHGEEEDGPQHVDGELRGVEEERGTEVERLVKERCISISISIAI